MKSVRYAYFFSCFALGFVMAACAGSGKDDSTSIMKASGAGPGANQKACTESRSSDPTKPQTTVEKKACEAANDQDINESELTAKTKDGEAACPENFAITLKSNEKQIALKDAVDQQDGSWDLAKTEIFVEFEDKTTHEKNQMVGIADGNMKDAQVGAVNQDAAAVTCHTSLAKTDSNQAAATTVDWSSLILTTDLPNQINRKDGSITTFRKDLWSASHGQVKAGSVLHAKALNIETDPETNVFVGSAQLTYAVTDAKDSLVVIQRTMSQDDGKHLITTLVRATYSPSAQIVNANQKDSTQKPATDGSSGNDNSQDQGSFK